jgi:hypothetical protein
MGVLVSVTTICDASSFSLSVAAFFSAAAGVPTAIVRAFTCKLWKRAQKVNDLEASSPYVYAARVSQIIGPRDGRP